MRIGYARVSTADQNPDLQEDALPKGRVRKDLPRSLSILAEVWLKPLIRPVTETRWSCGSWTGSAVP